MVVPPTEDLVLLHLTGGGNKLHLTICELRRRRVLPEDSASREPSGDHPAGTALTVQDDYAVAL